MSSKAIGFRGLHESGFHFVLQFQSDVPVCHQRLSSPFDLSLFSNPNPNPNLHPLTMHCWETSIPGEVAGREGYTHEVTDRGTSDLSPFLTTTQEIIVTSSSACLPAFCTQLHRTQTLIYYFLAELDMGGKKDSNLGYQVGCSCQLSLWSSGIRAEERWYISIDTVQLSGWIQRFFLGPLGEITPPPPPSPIPKF